MKFINSYLRGVFLLLCISSKGQTASLGASIQQQEELPELPVRDGTEEKLSVEALLARLDPRLATLLRLYYLEALTVQEIADIFEVPVGTIKSRLYYARKLMMNVLEE